MTDLSQVPFFKQADAAEVIAAEMERHWRAKLEAEGYRVARGLQDEWVLTRDDRAN